MENQFAIKTLVSDDVYTDREEFLELFYEESLKAATRRSMSIVLFGQRRMGKTEIFKRVVNRLFFEQDHKDPNAVVPVYYKFPDNTTNPWAFSIEYVKNFIKWYTAFRMRNPDVFEDSFTDLNTLFNYVKSNIEMTPSFERSFNLFKSFQDKSIVYPEKAALNLPRTISDRDDSTIVMFLDEIQNLHLPQHDFNIVGYMQDAVESPTCPHYVTGSAMTILHDILGKGSLYGRFDAESIKPLTDFYGAKLAGKAASYYHADVSKDMEAVISERCGGNPFYINSVVRRSARLKESLNSEKAINTILAIDLSSGFIYQELRDQVIKWIDRLNNHNITKWILYLASLEDKERIDPERIQEELKRQEGEKVDLQKINEVMIKLAQGDLIEYKSLGDWFNHVNDPILQEFLRVWGKIEVAGIKRDYVEREVLAKYESLKKKYRNYKGYFAEVAMIQIFWNAQGKTLPGKFFNYHEDIKMPLRFAYVDHRSKLGLGYRMEIDVLAASGVEVWVAESKWWNKQKVNSSIVKRLMDQGKRLKEIEGDKMEILRLWLFANDGVTENARNMLLENNILWSTRENLDALLKYLNLSKLPEL
jgi:hypothetical protein